MNQPAADAAAFIIGGPWRALIGLLLLAAAGSALWTARTIDWGVAWTTAIPAAVLLIPASGLLRRRVLRWRDADGEPIIELTDGWLWRRRLLLPVAGTELEILPTAGLYAVVLHRDGGMRALATWIRPPTATRLAAWLDDGPAGRFARRAPALPVGDR